MTDSRKLYIYFNRASDIIYCGLEDDPEWEYKIDGKSKYYYYYAELTPMKYKNFEREVKILFCLEKQCKKMLSLTRRQMLLHMMFS